MNRQADHSRDDAILDYAAAATRRRRWPARVVACTTVLVTGLLAMLVIPRGGHSPRIHWRVRCESQLRQIAIGCIMYANDHRGQFPPTLDTILSTDGFTPDLLLCPSATAMAAQRGARATATTTSPGPGAHSSYIYCGKGVTTRERDWDVIIAVEPLDNHGSEGVNIAFADARTEWLDATRARKVLDQVYNGTRPVRLTSK